jgi:hypothetical protein
LRGGYVRHQLKDPIEVETTYGFETASLARNTCSCSNQRNRTCIHRQQLYRWVNNFDRYLALSALHKEIRRGDLPKVKSWANIILQFQSPQSILKYLERIVFEETRDIHLWISLKRQKISLVDALDRITLIPKKWQLKNLNKPSHFESWYLGFKTSLSRDCPLPIELCGLLKESRNLAEVYSIYFYIKRDKALRTTLISLLHDLSKQKGNRILTTFLSFNPNSSYELMIALELMLGIYDETEVAHPKNSVTITPFIPLDQVFYHDIHTSFGKKQIRKHFLSAMTKLNFQNSTLDLRFSGSIFGCLFREKCSQQYGGLSDDQHRYYDWSDVLIDKDCYQKALELEKYYYPSIREII